ncbi:O-antigen polymerase (plasmid) [Deinococcus radiomollis]|uniref:O-antigen polymerase n=1 Tax=Deinococcus radiomollis TaxID=468916 RepID=UPI0038925409
MNLIASVTILLILVVNLTQVIRDIRHPSNLFLIAWLAAFTLLSIPIIYYVPISPTTYIFLLCSIAVFSFSSILGGTVYKKRIDFENSMRKYLISNRLLVTIGIVGLITALTYYQSRFGLVRMLNDPGSVRTEDTGGTGLLGILIFLPTVVFVLLAIQAAATRKIEIFVVLYMIIIFLYMLFLPERTTLINTLVWSGLSTYAVNTRAQVISFNFVKRYLPRAVLLIVVFIGFFVFVSERTQKVLWLNNVEYALNLDVGVPKALFDPYAYLTGNIPAIGIIVDESLKYGTMFKFDPNKTAIFPRRIMQIFTGSASDDALTSNSDFVNIPFAFNTYSWLSEPLQDYGLVGTMVYVALYGFLVGLAWSYRNWSLNPISCFLYGWAGTASVISILTNKFSSIYFNYALLTILLIYALKQLIGGLKR